MKIQSQVWKHTFKNMWQLRLACSRRREQCGSACLVQSVRHAAAARPCCAVMLMIGASIFHAQNDTKKLAEAKQLVYLKGFTDGVLIVGEYAGKKVSRAEERQVLCSDRPSRAPSCASAEWFCAVRMHSESARVTAVICSSPLDRSMR